MSIHFRIENSPNGEANERKRERERREGGERARVRVISRWNSAMIERSYDQMIIRMISIAFDRVR